VQLRVGQKIKLVVNGEATETAAASLADLVGDLGYAESEVATAVNGEFVARAARADTGLAADDQIEIVAPRQGG
jgi:sulfur carrier protein